MAETWSSSFTDSLDQNLGLYDALSTATTSNEFPSSSIGKQLATVTKLMNLPNRDTDRDVFYVQYGSFDHHGSMPSNLDTKFSDFDAALIPFVDELKAMGLWESTVVVETSDFARTLNPNSGDGTDHAWGGNTFMLGGNVKGGVVKGDYPRDLSDDGHNVLSRGRVIPSVPYDALWFSVAEWAGVTTASEMEEILPNVGNFDVDDGTLFRVCQLFNTKCPTASPTRAPTLAPTLSPTVPTLAPTLAPTTSPTADIITVQGELELKGMMEGDVTDETLDTLVDIFAELCGVSKVHVNIAFVDRRARRLQEQESDAGDSAGVVIRYTVEVPEALADEIVLILGDQMNVQGQIMGASNFAEAFPGFTGTEVVEAPEVVVINSPDDGAEGDQWYEWWTRTPLSETVGLGVSGGVAAACLGGLVFVVVRRRRNSKDDYNKWETPCRVAPKIPCTTTICERHKGFIFGWTTCSIFLRYENDCHT
jgi:hypothetical protein